ncbi:MAG: NFACT family protein [Synergistaceae bacterium]|jgi:predicted ribosome quality control (RQC) complex YloA/Tae2 family protein|nr:NFACT family protein [Synergistaceae bacterium]
MALGPELIFAQAADITREFKEHRVRRANAGNSWASITFSRDRTIFFSWDPEFYGICRVSDSEIRELEGSSTLRPPLLDAIRAHIAGADLSGVSQLNRDRVLKLEFRRTIGAGFFQTRCLVCEVCGRYSNIIVTGEGGRIIEAAKHILPEKNRYRAIIPGHVYSAPPELDGISIDDIDARDGGFLRDIAKFRGIGRPFGEAVKKLPPGDAAKAIDFLKKIDAKPCYQIYPYDGNYVTLSPELLPGARALVSADSLSAARETVVIPLIRRRIEACKKKISSMLDAAERANEKRTGEYAVLSAGAGEAEQLKRDGRLILAEAHAIRRRAEFATLTEWTDAGPEERKIRLDPEKNAAGNAEALFAKYRKKKSAVAMADAMLPNLYQKRYELKEQRALLERNNDWNTLSMMRYELERQAHKGRKTEGTRENFHAGKVPHGRAEFPDDGAVIFWGLSARGNRYVTFRLSKADDIWLHAQNIPGAHVVLRFGAKPDEKTFERIIQTAASCAVFYSGYRGSGNIRVDYTERRHVRAIQGAGAASVTYKEFRTIMADTSLWDQRESRRENL